jgi:hypothetical protein
LAQDISPQSEGVIAFISETTGMSVREVPRKDIERAIATGKKSAFDWEKTRVNNLTGPAFYGARIADTPLRLIIDTSGRLGIFEGGVPMDMPAPPILSSTPQSARPLATGVSEPSVSSNSVVSVSSSGRLGSPSRATFLGSLPAPDQVLPTRFDWDKAILCTPPPEPFSSAVGKTGLYKVPYVRSDGADRFMLAYVNHKGEFFLLDFVGENLQPTLITARKLDESVITAQGHRNLGFEVSQNSKGYAKVDLYLMHPDLGSGYGFSVTPELMEVARPKYVVSV